MIKQYAITNADLDVLEKTIDEISHKFKGKIKLNDQKLTIKYKDNDNYDNEIDNIFNKIKEKNPNIIISEEETLPTVRRVLVLDGLDCANCAAKIERIAKRTFDHELISVDFATTRFIIETNDKELLDNLIEEVQEITEKVDNTIKVKTKAEQLVAEDENRIPRKEKIYFTVGVSLFVLGVIARYSLLSFDIRIPDWGVILMYGIAYILLGKDVISGAFKNISSGRIFDEKFLMTLATMVALGIGYYEEAVSVMIFYKIGELFQDYAVNKSRRSIASLVDIKPDFANVIVEGEIVEVDPMEVLVGDIILIKPGERVPLDGIVVEGEAAIDASALTGEANYLDVREGDKVISGSVNVNGLIKVKVVKIYQDSMVAKILDMIENASSLKSKSENFISKFAKYYTPTIVIIAVLVGIRPFLLIENPVWADFQKTIYQAMIFLVASCPCALVLSIPLGFFGGIGGASKKGILVKGSNYLEVLGSLESIVFDKTGTLTKGSFKVEKIVPAVGSKEELLELAAYGELTSNHPIAKSIINEYGKENIKGSRVKIHSNPPKTGNRIILDDSDVIIANGKYLKHLGIDFEEIETDGVVVHVVKDMQYQGYIIIKDQIREEAKETIAILKDMKIKTAIFTGDKELEAKEVAKDIGIDEVYYDMDPIDKVNKLQELKQGMSSKKKQAFVGDGINDAPVLSSADVGIAMGALGSDAAIKVADVVLMTDDLKKIPTAIKISKKTRRIVIQNVILALAVKLIVLTLAPLGITTMWEAIFADVGVSLIAILNSLRAAKIND